MRARRLSCPSRAALRSDLMPDSNLSDEERRRLRDLEAGVAALRERTHAQNNGQQKDAALIAMFGKIEQKIEAVAATKPPDTPLWLKVGGASLAAIVALALIVGMIVAYGRSGAEIVARIAAIEAWKVDIASVPNRLQALETGVDMAKRVRDQQQQGMSDRLVGLEQSDRNDREAMNRVMQTLATITAQLQAMSAQQQELLRRQDRLENRLGARPGSAPNDEQPAALRILPLVWRPAF
jgi:hypothetical protein